MVPGFDVAYGDVTNHLGLRHNFLEKCLGWIVYSRLVFSGGNWVGESGPLIMIISGRSNDD